MKIVMSGVDMIISPMYSFASGTEYDLTHEWHNLHSKSKGVKSDYRVKFNMGN